jgi:hypothetical protein
MVRFDGRMLAVALQALLLGCAGASHQPERPAVAPPSTPSAPEQKAVPNMAPQDSGSGSGTYPWQSGPIAAL